jgi:hypothetical protein
MPEPCEAPRWGGKPPMRLLLVGLAAIAAGLLIAVVGHSFATPYAILAGCAMVVYRVVSMLRSRLRR